MLDSIACALVKLIGGFLCRLPPALAVWCGARLGQAAAWLQPKRTQIGRRNLRAAFDGMLTPREEQRIIRDGYRQLGAGFVELLRLPVIDRAYLDRYITIEGYDRLERALASGRPVIFLTAHYGNWELASIVAALKGHPIVALARAQQTLPKLYALLVSYRESKGCRVIHKGGAMKQLFAALDAGQPVGIVGDQASRQGIWIDFFGRPALFATGPFELAYAKEALILPAFVHRVRGPFHRIVLEPPIALSRALPHEAAIRDGLEQFADLLARHIQDAPHQWLWMHKRWKHTPARLALVLSDGKLGHTKQSLAVVGALQAACPALTHHVIEVRFRHVAARMLAAAWSWLIPNGWGGAAVLRWTLTPESAATLLGRYADVVISCGASAVPVNLLWSRHNQAKSIVLMSPAPFPLSRFQLVIAPRHDSLPARRNVVQTLGSLVSPLSEDTLAKARVALEPRLRAEGSSPRVSTAVETSTATRRQAVIAVFFGGDTAHDTLSPAFAEALTAQILAACEARDAVCLMTTSRRTSPAVDEMLSARLSRAPRCRLLLLASRDALNGTMEGMLGCADVAVVTGESISMVSEACASGRRVLVVELPRRANFSVEGTKHQRFLRELAREGFVRIVPLPELSPALQHALQDPRPPRRLDNFAAVRDAVARLV